MKVNSRLQDSHILEGQNIKESTLLGSDLFLEVKDLPSNKAAALEELGFENKDDMFFTYRLG